MTCGGSSRDHRSDDGLVRLLLTAGHVAGFPGGAYARRSWQRTSLIPPGTSRIRVNTCVIVTAR